MRILVTGAGGLIGGYLASAFVQDGWHVIALYRNKVPTIAGGVKGDVEYLQMDLSNGLDGLKPVDVIIHAAAHTHLIPNSTAEDYIRSNLIGTLNLVKYAKANRPAVFVYLSTVSMYGDVTVADLEEDTPAHGAEMYGMTKYMGERILRDHAEDFPSVSVRLPGVVGPGYFTPWIGSALLRASRDEDILVYNPESLFNNGVDLEELSRFVFWVIGSGIGGFEAVNLAAGEPLPIREVVELIVSLTGSKSNITEQATDRRSFLINCAKVKSVFGFDPATTKSIIQRYVAGNLTQLKVGPRSGR